MDKLKIQELAIKIKTLAASPNGVDQEAAMKIAQAAIQIEDETRKKPFYPSATVV